MWLDRFKSRISKIGVERCINLAFLLTYAVIGFVMWQFKVPVKYVLIFQ